MFVHYFTDVPVPLGFAEKRIDEIRSNFDEWAGVAYRDGEQLRAKVGPGLNAYAKEVRLEIGGAEIHRMGLVYSIHWTATGAGALFPQLNANLILSHLGANRTKLSLEGTYDPPLGPLGRVVDRMLLRSVAEATVKDWVDRVADAIAAVEPVS